jgi:hypothetical protein
MTERLSTRAERVRDWPAHLIEVAVTFAVENALATKDELRHAFEDALELADEPEPGDPGLRWQFAVRDDESEEPPAA